MGDLSRVAAVILAAGSSRRLGRPKQLIQLDGKPLLQHVIDAAQRAGVGQVVVVLGHEAERIRSATALPSHGRYVDNPQHETGQGSSLRIGIGALGDDLDRAVILLGDEPKIASDVIARVATGQGPIRRATYHDGVGHPVAFDRVLWPELMTVHGDQGARVVLAAHADNVQLVSVDAAAPVDVDTDADVSALGVSG